MSSSKIVLVGPNIMQAGTTGFHVHAIGCRDLRQPKYGVAEKETVEVADLEALARYVYSDHIAESPDPSDISAFVGDFTVYPCAKELVR